MTTMQSEAALLATAKPYLRRLMPECRARLAEMVGESGLELRVLASDDAVRAMTAKVIRGGFWPEFQINLERRTHRGGQPMVVVYRAGATLPPPPPKAPPTIRPKKSAREFRAAVLATMRSRPPGFVFRPADIAQLMGSSSTRVQRTLPALRGQIKQTSQCISGGGYELAREKP